MFHFLMRRLVRMMGVAVVVSAISFCLLFLAGDPAAFVAGEGASATDIALIRERMGFDQPILVQYGSWLLDALHGDLGKSYYFNLPVAELIWRHLPATMTLGACALLFSLVVGIPLGVLSAVSPGGWLDRFALAFSVLGQAMPTFWLSLVLVVAFSLTVPLLPASGSDTWRHFILPTVVLGNYACPAILRLTRACMLDALSSDYVRTARAKGIPAWLVWVRHALPNALAPVVSIGAVQLGYLLTGSIIIESVFAIQGTGYLAWQSISRADVPTVQGIMLVFSILYVVLTLAADLLNAWLDPRLRSIG